MPLCYGRGNVQGLPNIFVSDCNSFGYFSSPDSEIRPENPLRIVDLTGDAVPEILLFLGAGRWRARLSIFHYTEGKIQYLFGVRDAYAFPEFMFTDQNHNGILEITVTGLSPQCNACQRVQITEVFEYNSNKNLFELTNKF